jgi:glycosyltransferase involved in cell wall biosynthesis
MEMGDPESKTPRSVGEPTSSAPTFSVIIPTVGRPLLSRVLGEVVPQLGAEDEVLVVGDGRQPEAERMVREADPRVRYLEFESAHCWGHPQRNWAMERARGTHLLSLDDDDALRSGALEAVRSVSSRFPDRPLAFRVQYGSELLWREPRVACGNVTTQMFVVPNVKERLGRWGDRYEGDYDFIRSTALLYPLGMRSILWREEIIALHGLGGNDPRAGGILLDPGE